MFFVAICGYVFYMNTMKMVQLWGGERTCVPVMTVVVRQV